MRAVVQRVQRAVCRVDGQITGQIQQGLLVFVGIGAEDADADAVYLADKIAHLRVFEDSDGRMNLDVQQVSGGILLISQFTLYGDCRKGRRPDFTAAAGPEKARQMYEQFIELLRVKGLTVQTGIFAAMMEIDCVQDGPVTILLDSRRLF
ncbi:MAG TPA: D-aminoacyl-tRNA deacylase [Anaerohalosphaeraceae bacterium]|nr:D-aminoacyl-tRNA deacylase [Anaerohalosphaeraceae bacterium]HOL87791.1 D-aminoacyl-tRNA deacylase [Anaerohalosphaeraceae bacterium]HPP55143.1 D-aminoacyl-tRNA deacylase [Anaerohalosphaeraceae bacterium]